MDSFDLDLGSIEREIDGEDGGNVVLGFLDGETNGDSWLREIERGNVLVLNIVGDLNDLADEFAQPVKESGGSLVHFRGFLIVTPPGCTVDTDRLS